MRIRLFLFLIALGGFASPALAWPWIEIFQDLSFGTFAVRNNTASHTIIIAPDNTATVDPDLIAIIDAERGEYLITDLPLSSAIGVDVTDGTLSDGAGPTFTVTDYTYNAPLVSNGAGELTLYVGATLSTSGNGQHYNSGNYSGSVDLSVNY